MVHPSHSFYLNFFLGKDINVFVWNYRGYGRSSGMTTPSYLRKDAETVLDFVKNKLGFVGKIGVYGRSLGGISSSYLANKVEMAIIDRSFGNLKDMAMFKYYGHAAWLLLAVASCGW